MIIDEGIRTNCRFCDETYDMGAVIHTCRKIYKSFHDFGVCPCTKNCKYFDDRSDYQRGYDDAMNNKKKETNIYIVDEYLDNKDDWIVATTYGVFTNFNQAFYTLYSLISHRLVDYRSNGKQTIFYNSPSYDLKSSGCIEGFFITVYDDEYDNEIEYAIRSIELDKIDEFSQACFKG